jgi:hypothetical protein
MTVGCYITAKDSLGYLLTVIDKSRPAILLGLKTMVFAAWPEQLPAGHTREAPKPQVSQSIQIRPLQSVPTDLEMMICSTLD